MFSPSMRSEARGKVIEQRTYVAHRGGDDYRKVAQRIVADLKAGTLELRPLPRVAVELGRLASSGDPDMSNAMQIINRDAKLAGKVLKAASSTAFGKRPPRDLQQAAMRLGVVGLRNMAFAASMGAVFRCPPLDELVREQMSHGFVTAVLSAHVCKLARLDTQTGFLCGLFHDVGHMVVLSALAAYGAESPKYLDFKFVRRVGTAAHARLGAFLLSKWEVGPIVQDVAAHHHKAEDAKVAAGFATAVAIADHADHLGGRSEEERVQRLTATPCPQGVPLSEEHVALLAKAAHAARTDPILKQLER